MCVCSRSVAGSMHPPRSPELMPVFACATGRLEKYMAKRRRKNAAKDHRYIPGASRAGE